MDQCQLRFDTKRMADTQLMRRERGDNMTMMQTIEADNPNLVFVPLDKATVAPGGLINHIKDHWWIVHPEKGLVFWDQKARSPQCNTNESLTRRFAKSYPWAEVRFIPSVFHRIKISDYTD